MNYKITIEYTRHNDKAGKLTLEDNRGNKLLSKVAVAVPENYGLQSKKQGSLKINEHDFGYSELSSSFISLNKDNQNTPMFIGQEISIEHPLLYKDQKFIVLNKKDFDVLNKAMSNDNSNQCQVSIEKVGFLLSPDKINPIQRNYTEILKNKTDASILIQDKEKVLGRMLAMSSQMLKKAPEALIEKKPVEKKKIKSITHPDKKTLKSIPRYHDYNVSHFIDTKVENKGFGWGGQENLDAFDIYFITNNPTLGIMFKPNSLFAWMNFFQNDTNKISQDYVNANLQNIAGFQGVHHTNVSYNLQGYAVELFDTNNGLLGKLEYSNNSYEMSNQHGDKTYLKEDDRGVWSGYTEHDGRHTVDYEFAPASDGYVGNWSGLDSNGNPIGSGYSIDDSFNSYSFDQSRYNMDSYVEAYNIVEYETPTYSSYDTSNDFQRQEEYRESSLREEEAREADRRRDEEWRNQQENERRQREQEENNRRDEDRRRDEERNNSYNYSYNNNDSYSQSGYDNNTDSYGNPRPY